MKNIIAGAVVLLGIIALAVVLGLVIAYPVMLLWNWLFPAIFGLPTITYWQAYGLYILSALLVKSSSPSSSSKS